MRICCDCKLELEEVEFYIHKTRGLRSSCKKCENKRCAVYFKTEAGKAARSRAHYKLKGGRPELYILWSAKSGAKKRGLSFDLIEEDIVIPDVCPVLGIPLFWTKDKRIDDNLQLEGQ